MIEGTIDYIITVRNPLTQISADLLVTFEADGDNLNFNEMFKDTIGKYHSLNKDKIKSMLI
jgi:hypothetical protein